MIIFLMIECFQNIKKWEGKYEYEYKIIMFKYSYRIMNRIRSIKIDMNENKMIERHLELLKLILN